MLLWLPTSNSVFLDEGEKSAKVRRRARAQFTNALLLAGFLLTVASVVTVKLYHSPKTQGFRKAAAAAAAAAVLLPQNSIYRLSVKDAHGANQSLKKYAGMVTLVVNTACKCGKTEADFTQLAILQDMYKDRGFSVLAFPTTDFRQEFDTDVEIQSFLEQKFPETMNLPVFAVSSLHENPVYQQLHQHIPDQRVQHNFFKYLVNRDGIAVHLFTKAEDPLTLVHDIERVLLAQKST